MHHIGLLFSLLLCGLIIQITNQPEALKQGGTGREEGR
jgi:hypothetical protein